MAVLRARGPGFLGERFMAESPLTHCAQLATSRAPDGSDWPEAVIAVSLAPWRELEARLQDAERFLVSAQDEIQRLRSRYLAQELTIDLPVHRPPGGGSHELVVAPALSQALASGQIALRLRLLPPDFAGAETRHPRIVVHPEVAHGRPVIRGTRVLVRNLVDALAAGQTLWQIQEDFPDITAADVAAAVAFIAEQAEHA